MRIVQEIYSNIHLDFGLERDYFRCRCDIITNTLENEIPAIALWSSPQKCRRQRGEFPQSQFEGRFEPVQRNVGFLQTTHVTDNEFHPQERRRSLKITVRSLSFSQILRSQRFPATPSCLVINASLYRCVILNCASPLCKVSLPTFHHLFVVIPFIHPTCSHLIGYHFCCCCFYCCCCCIGDRPHSHLLHGQIPSQPTPHVVILMSTLTYFPFQPKAAQRTSQLELIRWTEQRSNLNKHIV